MLLASGAWREAAVQRCWVQRCWVQRAVQRAGREVRGAEFWLGLGLGLG